MSEPARATSRIGIVGYGRFGSSLAALAAEAGWQVRAHDPFSTPPRSVRADSPAELAQSSDLVIVAVPVSVLASALDTLRPHLTRSHLVTDVCSVKLGPTQTMSERLGREIPWIGTHPLFGPTSLAGAAKPLRAIVCPNPLHPTAAERAVSFYRSIGAEVLQIDADAHDRLMAETHAVAFYVAKGMIAVGTPFDTPFVPPSVQALGRIVDSVRSDAEHLFETLQRDNPYSEAARRRLLAALQAIDRDLAAPRPATPSPGPSPATEHHAATFDLAETRHIIDRVDRELVELLARRAQLAHRAAHAKHRLDRAIRDPAREAALLRSRSRWATELGLDARSVSKIFEAVLRFSRGVQTHGRAAAPRRLRKKRR